MPRLEEQVSKPIGVTIHHEDQSILKITISDLAAAIEALRIAYAGTSRSKSNYINADACPEHGPWSVQPGGVSKNTGNSYNAFWKCDGKVDGEFCPNRPTKAWCETHPTSQNDASQVAPSEPVQARPAEPENVAAEYDNLPF